MIRSEWSRGLVAVVAGLAGVSAVAGCDYCGLGDSSDPCGPNAMCVDDHCVPRHGSGEPCTYDGECDEPLHCMGGTCVPPTPPTPGDLYAPCLDGGCNDRTLVCDPAGFCVPIPCGADAPCSATLACDELVTHSCVAAGDVDQPCRGDGSCPGPGTCATNTCVCQHGICDLATHGVVGGPCDFNGVCQDDLACIAQRCVDAIMTEVALDPALIDPVAALDASGALLAVGDGTVVHLFASADIQTAVVTIDAGAAVRELAFSPAAFAAGTLLAAALDDGSLAAWDATDGSPVLRYSVSGDSPATSLSFSADGNALAVVHASGLLRVLSTTDDWATWDERSTQAASTTLDAVRFSPLPGEGLVAVAGGSFGVRSWTTGDTLAPSRLFEYGMFSPGEPVYLSFDVTGQKLFVVTGDGARWQLNRGTGGWTDGQLTRTGVTCAAVAPSTVLAAAGDGGGFVHVGEQLSPYRERLELSTRGVPTGAAFSDDRHLFVVGRGFLSAWVLPAEYPAP